MSVQDRAGAAAGRAGNSDALEHLARVGLVAYGLVHLLIAWLALQLAWGRAGQEADQSGALATLAQQPLGTPLLWVLAVGLVALALWQAAEILRWRHGWSASGEARKRAVEKTVKAAAKAVVYAALAVLAIRFATGGGQSGGGSQQQATAGVFGWPAGRWLVGAAGLVVVGVAVYLVHKGVTKRFLKEIDLSGCSTSARRLVTRLGQVGFPAKGVALGLVGGLLVWAAVTFDPAKASGLDGALHTVLTAPAGPVLLTLIAVGIAAFGAYCFVRARYPERT
ncbi:DUF1206 domain-containing protein [Blastococcus sp. MG754426]|uniref:DUF1206 domain-containing protein n=1 Tax=unclassified Blastococcus TaxID=2619396 RepID=UPI001EEF8FF4|nr:MULTISPECIES: DUF1206 domain-containing protein [unclassified Blastococcus]MCF6509761.1 DUF1206 domain-containing protein [Blastococcus sp. MG754426]MCF6514160.1 DUF1206 domain-containing protein [Blastococcus sp. MG754427]MCF6737265.1 DUF1206 domain-containing protein [Blastococcus sp. KM273129]